MSTASQVKAHLNQDGKYWKRNGAEYSGPSPLRSGSDSNGFHLTIDDEERGRFNDFVSGEKGSLYTLAQKLGIALPKRVAGRETRSARSLADYEADKGLPAGYLAKRGWTEGHHDNRACLLIPVDDGTKQVRYIDGGKGKWTWEKNREEETDGGGKLSFYGSGRAKELVKEQKLNFMVWVNGAGSVEVLQHYGVPAFALVGGELNIARKVYVDRVLKVLEKFQGVVFIALDCDKTGREGAAKLSVLLGDKGIVLDLGGSDGFDGADFANLWQEQSLSRLMMLAEEADNNRPIRTAKEAAEAVLKQIEGKRKLHGRFIPQPFSLLHKFGGGALSLDPDLMTGIVALSGHGKTAWWQSWIMELLESPRNWGIMVDSREFTPTADSIRRMQGEAKREGVKISSDIIKSHLIYMQEDEEGIPIEHRFGKKMRPELIAEVRQINAFMQMAWKGSLEFAQEAPFIEDTLNYMKRRTLEAREHGENMDLWVFDYLTLYRCKPESLEGTGKNLYGVITQMIKDAARAVHVHAIIMMQPNKSPAADALSRNERLKITDIAYVNENDFNFVLGLNVLYGTQAEWQTGFDNRPGGAWCVMRDPATNKPLVDKAMLRDGTYAAIVEVLKNTGGIKGQVPIKADFAAIRWVNESWQNEDLRLPLNEGFGED